MTYHGDGQGPGGDTVDDLVDLIRVDAKTIKGTGGRQLDMSLRRQIGRVASKA